MNARGFHDTTSIHLRRGSPAAAPAHTGLLPSGM
jgi:hypothetical protein